MRFINHFLMITFLTTHPSFAENSQSIFVVPEVEVSIPLKELGQNSFAKIVKLGQKEAFQKLVLKLTTLSDSTKIPNLKENEIAQLISKVDVHKEIKTNTLYKANLNYYFVPSSVKEVLSKASLGIIDIQRKNVLIIPVLKIKEGEIKLWEEQNPWRQIWSNYPHKDKGMVPFKVPFADFEDMGILSAQQAIEGDQEALKKLAEKYQCEDCLVSLASLEEGNPKETGLVISTHFYGTESHPSLVVKVSNSSKERLYAEGLKQVIAKIEENWKTSPQSGPIPEKEIEFRVALSGPADFDAIERELKKLSFVKNIVLLSMTSEEAFVKLGYAETEEKLKQNLESLNLQLIQRENKYELEWKKNFGPSMNSFQMSS